MPKGNTNAIRVGNLHFATARLPSHIHQSKSTVQGLVSFFTGYPPGKGADRHLVRPADGFLSSPACSRLVTQGGHSLGCCSWHHACLERYRGWTDGATCSWSGA